MEVKSLGTLNTVRLKLSPFLPRPLAMLYFEHPVLKTVCLSQHCFGGGGGVGPLEASKQLQKWILSCISIFDMLPLWKENF